MTKLKCACGSLTCPIGIEVSVGTGLFLLDGDGRESLMYLDAKTLAELQTALAEFHAYYARQSGDAGYNISGELVGKPTRPIIMLQTEDAATLYLLARITLAFVLAYQQKTEKLVSDPETRRRIEQVVSRLQGQLADAGMSVVEAKP